MLYPLNGHSLALNRALCSGCARCLEVCPHAVFLLSNGRASVARREHCMECGACRMNCEAGAVQVNSAVGCVAAIIGSLRKPAGGDNASCSCG
jgi:NAD-dependent dihydropyrimidine dehydrogenase PreA subunit